MSKELAKTYDPKGIEDRIYQKWLDKKYFHAEVDRSKKPFTIVMPPPNVTGQLHMGHALDNTMQDILIRYKRMQGYNALWQPGTDHAAIATEVKVIQKLKEQGIDKNDIGREEFLKHAWEWKEEYGGRIVNQLKKLGSSADWDRERFTMDEGCSKAVEEVFVKLYEQRLYLQRFQDHQLVSGMQDFHFRCRGRTCRSGRILLAHQLPDRRRRRTFCGDRDHSSGDTAWRYGRCRKPGR